MKFFCQQCNTKYSISDAKVRGKVLKIRCKKCKAIIVVREAKKTARPQPERAAPSPRRAPSMTRGAARSQRSSSAPMAAAARAPAAQLQDFDDRDDSTRVTSPGEIQQLLGRKDDGPSGRARPAAGRARDDLLWYLASKGKQSRPMTQAQISDKIRKGQVGPRVFAWNQTMKDWIRLGKLDAFRADFDAAPSGQGGKVVDFQKKVAERRAAQARKRERAVDALDQIAELVQQAPIEPEPDPVREPSRPGVEPAGAEAATAQVGIDVAEDSFEDLFFDPGSVASFVSEGVEKDAQGDALLSAGGAGADLDPFSMVPDNVPPSPPKESTRVFVAAAGLKNRARKQKIYAVMGVSLGLLLIGSIALDAVGVIEIPLLHGYVQSVKLAAVGKKKAVVQAPAEEHLPLTEAERVAIRKALLEGNTAAAEEVRRKARRRARLALNLQGGVAGVDLSDNVRGGAQDSHLDRRGGGAATNVKLSAEEMETLKGINERSGIDPVAIRVKQGIGKIKLPVTYEGGLQARQIAQVVGQNQKGVQRCATQETRRGLELPPSINMSLTIELSGVVSHTRIGDANLRSSPLGRCLSATVRQWRFPAFTGRPMDVDIPFKFTTIH